MAATTKRRAPAKPGAQATTGNTGGIPPAHWRSIQRFYTQQNVLVTKLTENMTQFQQVMNQIGAGTSVKAKPAQARGRGRRALVAAGQT